MIDLFFHWLAPESTPTGRRYWLRWASVLVTAAVPRGPTRAGARAREGPSGEGGGGPARGPGKVGGAHPVGERLSPGPPCALSRAAERRLRGLRAEEGRGAVHSRDIRGSGAKGRRGGCVGGVGPSPPERRRPCGSLLPLLGPHPSRAGGGARGAAAPGPGRGGRGGEKWARWGREGRGGQGRAGREGALPGSGLLWRPLWPCARCLEALAPGENRTAWRRGQRPGLWATTDQYTWVDKCFYSSLIFVWGEKKFMKEKQLNYTWSHL